MKKAEQESKTTKKFVQEFRRVTRKNRYEKRLLIEEFKRKMNKMIRRKFMEIEYPSRSIE